MRQSVQPPHPPPHTHTQPLPPTLLPTLPSCLPNSHLSWWDAHVRQAVQLLHLYTKPLHKLHCHSPTPHPSSSTTKLRWSTVACQPQTPTTTTHPDLRAPPRPAPHRLPAPLTSVLVGCACVSVHPAAAPPPQTSPSASLSCQRMAG